jgi:hypothetical protein
MSDNDDISELWEDALDKYEKTVPERSRRDENLFITLKTPEALEAHLNKNEKLFKLFRSKHGKLTGRLKACMKPFMTLSDMISVAVSASPFAPAATVIGAVCFVLKAAEGVSEVYDWIEELFDKLRDFTTRLDEYVRRGLPKGFRNKIVDIFGCLLDILACAELAVRDGRWKKYTPRCCSLEVTSASRPLSTSLPASSRASSRSSWPSLMRPTKRWTRGSKKSET